MDMNTATLPKKGLKARAYSMDMNKDIATLPKKGLKTRPYNIGMEKKGLKKYDYNIDMEKKDLKKLAKGQLIKLLLKKVSNHEDLLDNNPFKDEVPQEPTINRTNDLILNLTPENMTQHSRIVTTTRKGSSTPTKMSKIIGRQIH